MKNTLCVAELNRVLIKEVLFNFIPAVTNQSNINKPIIAIL